MSERLTDERLDELLALRPGLSLNRESVAELHAMATELRSLRAAALTSEEVEALRVLRKSFVITDPNQRDPIIPGLFALDRLLAAAEVKS